MFKLLKSDSNLLYFSTRLIPCDMLTISKFDYFSVISDKKNFMA